MASYGKFQSDNKKYTRKAARVNVNNPDFNPAVDMNGIQFQTALQKNLYKWVEFIAWARFYPDLFYDLITPETGAKIRLGPDQRIILRCLCRFKSTYCVLPRGSGKTLISLMAAFHACIFYPSIQVSLTAQTKENAAKLIKDKYEELLSAFPLLRNEIYNAKMSNDSTEIEFHNGSKLSSLANAQSSKGAHVQRGIVDEDNLTDEETYLDVLEPIFTTVPRRTVGKKCLVDPNEQNGSISQLTSSGYRGSSAFYRCLRHFDNMIHLKGEICIGSSWELPCFFGRGSTKSQIMKKKDESTVTAFDMNYNAVWTGVSDSALVNISRLLGCRTLSFPDLKGDDYHEYVLGVDVARSDNANNNQTSIAILKIIRRKDGRIKEVQVPNIVTISSTIDFEAQSIEIKRIKNRYDASFIVIDDNGLGKGIGDSLVKEQIDPLTGESLGCYDTLNSERIPEVSGSPKIVFCYMAQKYDNESIPVFMDAVDTGKLRLLEKKEVSSYAVAEKNDNPEKLAPFVQTDFFVEEVSNLKLKHLSNGGLSIEKVVKKINKDRFSSIQYGLWYIMKFMDNKQMDTGDDLEELSKYIMW